MGSFAKSFGVAGGFISGSRSLVRHLRAHSHAFAYPAPVSPPVAAQLVAAMRKAMDGQKEEVERVRRLADNTRYFRRRLKQMGLVVYGDDDCPVITVLLLVPAKVRAFVEEMIRQYGINTVAVAFPAVPLTTPRAR